MKLRFIIPCIMCVTSLGLLNCSDNDDNDCDCLRPGYIDVDSTICYQIRMGEIDDDEYVFAYFVTEEDVRFFDTDGFFFPPNNLNGRSISKGEIIDVKICSARKCHWTGVVHWPGFHIYCTVKLCE